MVDSTPGRPTEETKPDLTSMIGAINSELSEKGLIFKQAEESERDAVAKFHTANYLDEIAVLPGEREAEEAESPAYFPQLYNAEYFLTSHLFIVVNLNSKEVLGCIGLSKTNGFREDEGPTNEANTIWINSFSVSKTLRG